MRGYSLLITSKIFSLDHRNPTSLPAGLKTIKPKLISRIINQKEIFQGIEFPFLLKINE